VKYRIEGWVFRLHSGMITHYETTAGGIFRKWQSALSAERKKLQGTT